MAENQTQNQLQNQDSVSFSMTSGNYLDPYFLHHADNPGITLVSQILIGDNYCTWSRSKVMGLTAKNKIGFVDGTFAKPSSSEQKFASWRRCSTMILSWILNSVSKEIAASITFVDLQKKCGRT